MIVLRKNMEDSEQAESVYDPEQTLVQDAMERCVSEYDPEQTLVPDEMEMCVSEYDPEQTLVPDEMERCVSEYDPEQKSVPGIEEDETAAEKDAAIERDASVEMCAAVEKDANAAEESERSEDLTGSEVFVFDGMEFRTPSELARYFQSYADESRRALSRKVRQLYADKGRFLPEFEAWLIAIGKEKELNSWKKKIQGIH